MDDLAQVDVLPLEGDVPQLQDTHQRPRGVSIEDIEEDDINNTPWGNERYVETFPRPAGIPIHPYKEKTKFEVLRESKTRAGQDRWAPFAGQDEWELAMWLSKNVGQKSVDEFLKLPITRDRLDLSFRTNYTFLQKVDALPTGPEWECEIITVVGDRIGEDGQKMREDLELWYRNPIDCVKELIGNPAFKDYISYTPERVFTSHNGEDRILDEMWTGDWWWDTQCKLPDGATIAPLILASDKTQLSQFQGDKKAWPVYLTLGNISKEVRRRPSAHATVLLGYLPVSKLDCNTDATRSLAGYRLFHQCLTKILAPLVQAGRDGVEILCADGFIRLIYIILAAYIADYPEQCLIACCMENRCPRCMVDPKSRGSSLQSPSRDPSSILNLLDAHHRGVDPREFDEHGIRAIYQPFWENLPYCNIFNCLMPDLLHQLHKGVFKDHLVKWCATLVGNAEIDARFKAMTGSPGLHHFKKGISTISQWTGTEHKEMQKVFLGVLAGSVPNARVLTVARALLDFIYYAQLQMHTTKTLNALQSCLQIFHENKDIFIELGIREHFDFPKLHSLLHYVASILALGTNDGYNSESPERLHIDFAKKAYRASNKKDYHEQMVLWLQCREAMWQQENYLGWLNEEIATADANDSESDASDDEDAEDDEVEVAPTTTAATVVAPLPHYRLAKTPPLQRISVYSLGTDFGAVNFLPALSIFLQQNHPTCAIVPNVSDRFNLYKSMTITLPPNPYLCQQARTNRVRAIPAIAPHGRNLEGSTAVFDTVLAIEDGAEYKSRHGLSGLRVAQVRAIFDLPQQFISAYPCQPLIYVEWFTPLGIPDAQTGMHLISRSTCFHRRNSAIITIDRIVRVCHLMGKCSGTIIGKGWTTSNVLEKAEQFYFNHYLHVDTFVHTKIR
ncbi:hypothetical protein BD779DRAFT_1612257 [Infundibulicybe gibba]|nr:hypothetical protein BD779DRAFT_1612257 [Infundibulicybe gibba]